MAVLFSRPGWAIALRLNGYLVAPPEIEAPIQCYPGIDGKAKQIKLSARGTVSRCLSPSSHYARASRSTEAALRCELKAKDSCAIQGLRREALLSRPSRRRRGPNGARFSAPSWREQGAAPSGRRGGYSAAREACVKYLQNSSEFRASKIDAETLVAHDERGMAGRLGRIGADQIRQDYKVSDEKIFAGHLSSQKQ